MYSESSPSCFSSLSAQVQSSSLIFSTRTFSPLHTRQSVTCHIKTLYSFQKYLQASLQVNQSEGELTEYGREGKGEGEGEGEKAVVQAMAHHHLRLILQSVQGSVQVQTIQELPEP